MGTLLTDLSLQAVLAAATSPSIGTTQPYDASGGALAPPLPALSGLRVGSRVAVQKSAADTSANIVTITCAVADTFDSGATTLMLKLAGEIRELKVVSLAGVKSWKVTGGNTPLGALATLFLGAQQVFSYTANGTFTPTVSGYYEIFCLGGGGGGGGGGAANTAGGTATQVGGGGGGAGGWTRQTAFLTAGQTYTVTVGTGGTGGAAGAANGGAGATATNGTTSSFAGAGIVTIQAQGGGKGAGGAGNSTSSVGGGVLAAGTTGINTTVPNTPGNGSPANSGNASAVIPSPFGVGGQGGSPADATHGGVGGTAAATLATGVGSSTAKNTTSAGLDGATPTVPGSGGGGGGGGAPGGPGGAGGAGSAGQVTVRLVG